MDLKKSTMVETARYELLREKDRHSWVAESDPSGLWTLEQRFHQLFAHEPPSARSQMGHQIEDMLLQCSFAGRQCYASNFSLLLNTPYGNCYTLQYQKFVSRMSGPADGLQLKLYLETGEYLPGITNSQGIQVVIHDQGTLPFPGEEGLAVRAGTETFIGLRRVEVSRLGNPHGKCTPVDSFSNRFGFKYTRVACQKVCQQRRTQRLCGCYENTQQEINTFLRQLENAKPCQTWEEIQCAMKISLHFEKDSNLCGCQRPCNETTFQRTVSSRNWPSSAFARRIHKPGHLLRRSQLRTTYRVGRLRAGSILI